MMTTLEDLRDRFYSSEEDSALESLLKTTPINDYTDLMKLISIATENHHDSDKVKPNRFVIESDNNEYIININIALLEAFSFPGIDDGQSRSLFIKNIAELPEDCTIYVITDLPIDKLNFLIIFDGMFICNLIRDIKAKKIYLLNKMINLVDLVFATVCDEVIVDELAAITITDAHAAWEIPQFLSGVYRDLVKYTFGFWMKKGLITSEERLGILSNETENGIFLLASEIRRRLHGGE